MIFRCMLHTTRHVNRASRLSQLTLYILNFYIKCWYTHPRDVYVLNEIHNIIKLLPGAEYVVVEHNASDAQKHESLFGAP